MLRLIALNIPLQMVAKVCVSGVGRCLYGSLLSDGLDTYLLSGRITCHRDFAMTSQPTGWTGLHDKGSDVERQEARNSLHRH